MSDDSVTAIVVELSEEPPDERMIHASQFVYPVWCNFERATVIVKYVDKEGRLRLTTKAKGDDCKRIADAAIPFEALASLVEFKRCEPGDAREETA